MKIVLNLALAAISTLIATTTAAPTSHPPTHWTYGQDNAGPQHWGQLDPLYGTCGTGHKQSPIDVAIGAPYVHVENKPFSNLHYPPIHNVLCGYDGHTVKCEWPTTSGNASGTVTNSITIKGKRYELTNFHFHSPSEHRINNHFAEAELHLVHTSKQDGALAVIGVLLQVQETNNPFFDWIMALDKKVNLAEKGHGFLVKDKTTGLAVPGKEQIKYKIDKVDFSSLLKSTGDFTPRWEYEGSLTTPPCTEGVAWNVVKKSVGLGIQQLDALVDLEDFNSRFLQDRP
ncbi:hypothetical protein BGZ46_007850 [Entomortierella lignicola]|nr:hypothetical protein BGZ46_007850 [Entomortierella lignicola]